MRGPSFARHPGLLAAVSLCFCCCQTVLADSATTELRIAIGLLRSQAAELELLQAESRRVRLPERAVRGHAIQLGLAVQRAREQLDKAPAPASAAAIRADAQAAGQQLAALVLVLSEHGPARQDPAALQAVPALRERLQHDEAALPH
ncbi:hypothetical protein [Ideonella sp. YS5]|uniref:hypothetical protein n=1 Tax=Ideonella sp. YS5 TaxID=3453714 RepID=UPI003EEAEAD6